MPALRIIIVDDHPLFRGALRQALSTSLDDAEILEAGSLDETTRLLQGSSDTDLVLLDLAMPGVHGLSGLLFLRAEHPEVPVVIVSASEDHTTVRRAIEFGAAGYIPKSQPVEQIRRAVFLVQLPMHQVLAVAQRVHHVHGDHDVIESLRLALGNRSLGHGEPRSRL